MREQEYRILDLVYQGMFHHATVTVTPRDVGGQYVYVNNVWNSQGKLVPKTHDLELAIIRGDSTH